MIKSNNDEFYRENLACGTGGQVRATKAWCENTEVVSAQSRRYALSLAISTLQLSALTGAKLWADFLMV